MTGHRHVEGVCRSTLPLVGWSQGQSSWYWAKQNSVRVTVPPQIEALAPESVRTERPKFTTWGILDI